MSNDKLKSIMALATKMMRDSWATGNYASWQPAYQALESAIREAIAAPGVAQGRVMVQLEARPCTCHPDDNPPQPCAQKYALTECRAPSPTAEQTTPPASSPLEAARSVAKWLNERPNRPINLEDVAMLVHYVQSASIKGGTAE